MKSLICYVYAVAMPHISRRHLKPVLSEGALASSTMACLCWKERVPLRAAGQGMPVGVAAVASCAPGWCGQRGKWDTVAYAAEQKL